MRSAVSLQKNWSCALPKLGRPCRTTATEERRSGRNLSAPPSPPPLSVATQTGSKHESWHPKRVVLSQAKSSILCTCTCIHARLFHSNCSSRNITPFINYNSSVKAITFVDNLFNFGVVSHPASLFPYFLLLLRIKCNGCQHPHPDDKFV